MYSSAMRRFLFIAPLVATQGLAAVLCRDEKIKWGDCDIDTAGLPVQCGKLKVPLDYTNDSSTTIDLELIKLSATKQPAPKGSILLNFGGPGGDGLNNFIANIPIQQPCVYDPSLS